MRFRLLRRRLTISAPRVAVRSSLAWPLRWIVIALALGFCAAIAMWAFELGRSLAGLDRSDKQELAQLRDEVQKLRSAREEAVLTGGHRHPLSRDPCLAPRAFARRRGNIWPGDFGRTHGTKTS